MRGLIKFGNMKLPTTTGIFNMGSAYSCPSLRLGLCQAFVNGKCVCYAFRDERRFSIVRAFRNRQAQYWARVSAKRFAADFMAIVERRRIQTHALRLNESGDFRAQRDVLKASEIARLLASHGIRVYCYTARRDLDFSGVDRNLAVNGSGFRVHGEFLMIRTRADKPKGYAICPASCKRCRRCLTGSLTCVVVH